MSIQDESHYWLIEREIGGRREFRRQGGQFWPDTINARKYLSKADAELVAQYVKDSIACEHIWEGDSTVENVASYDALVKRDAFAAWANLNQPWYKFADIDRFFYSSDGLQDSFAVWNGGQESNASRIDQLEKELAEARKDAERYRWLRDHGERMIGPDRGMGPEWTYGEELDAAIDAAMEAK